MTFHSSLTLAGAILFGAMLATAISAFTGENLPLFFVIFAGLVAAMKTFVRRSPTRPSACDKEPSGR
jgi:hypothetical protein